jgi:phosphatidylserine/phosphatidylglycerophosphate/cardiolipin synthase-like enzyme
MIKLIHNEAHYSEVIQRVHRANRFVWLGTADIKDLHVKGALRTEPFLATLNQLATRKVPLRMLYAKHPGPNFTASRKKYPVLKKSMEEQLCIRVHFKLILIDGSFAYIGSANLTGAGIGLKSKNNRNFESGIITDEPTLIDDAMEQFDKVWRGAYCKDCGRKQYCPAPIA